MFPANSWVVQVHCTELPVFGAVLFAITLVAKSVRCDFPGLSTIYATVFSSHILDS
jgi:hypothetical protein